MIDFIGTIKTSFRSSLGLFTRNIKNQSCIQNSKSKRLTPQILALEAALSECRKEAKKSIRWRVLPSPYNFERAAMLFRQSKNYQNEIKICQLYISLVNECISNKTFNRSYLEIKAKEQCNRIAIRLEAVQKLQSVEVEATGVDVQYIMDNK